jgi:putative membrane-bound dehydrogenase-like protein
MYVPEGFKVDLVVGEPDLHQPVAFAFDERGRIWVAEAYSYPQKQPAGKGLDKLVIFEDRDGDGKFETRKVFAEGLNLVSGFEVGYGGVWVGAAPELLFIPDRNHDDMPDGPVEVLLDGFGFQDTHECLNSFLWGPDGWLYGIQGVFNLAHIGKPGSADKDRRELRAGVWRYHPVRREFEVFAEGGSNPWGIDYDEHGQLFMTHCRSYWGRGGTTHVIQGGQFWNQANANYAPFIVADPPADFPEFRNYLLASARYDHGAGGAGAPGTDAIYGGHSHVGTMIYLGDNWPDEFRGHLFTHNLHGHQINQQVNRRVGSGFDTVHAGRDQFFCSDPMYVAVDLQYGPDGAVYFIDWYDQQHCHNPNTERWDRSNGRIYRMEWQATYQPAKVDLAKATDVELLGYQSHRNEWFGRTARRLLHERSVLGQVTRDIQTPLSQTIHSSPDAFQRLRALWLLHLTGSLSEALAEDALHDSDEYIRAWTIQLLTERRNLSPDLTTEFQRLAKTDPSPVVRLYLASALQRVPDNVAWELAQSLVQHGEDREDRNLTKLLWHGIAPRVSTSGGSGLALSLAQQTLLPSLADWIYWYVASLPGDGLGQVIGKVGATGGEDQRRLLSGIALALRSQANVAQPATWSGVATALYASKDPRIVRLAESIAAALGETSRFPLLREKLVNPSATTEDRRHALEVLSRATDAASLPAFLKLLDDAAFRTAAIAQLARYDSAEIPPAFIQRWKALPAPDRATALNVMVSRVSYANALLDAVAAGTIGRDQLTAFHIRQLSQLGNASIDGRVASTWGKIKQSPAEKRQLMDRLEKDFTEAPLWAYSASAGKEHFKKLCAQCHRYGEEGARFGPELTGANRNGVRYFLENVIDPNAVVGTDFQMTVLETKGGESLSGLVVEESASAVTLRTPTEQRVVPKADVQKRTLSDQSLMPEGLLESLGAREQIELLKFLMAM